MMNKRIILSAITMCLVSMSALASLPSHNPVFVDQLNDTFTGDGYQASVTSTVYELGPTAGGYLYTYQITGSTTKFTWFSVAFYKGTSIMDYSYETPGTTPFAWEPVDNVVNPNSIEAFFKSGLTAGNSALLWYTSPTGPVPGVGALAKLSVVGGGAYAEGLVLVPQVPEPMTLSLLGFGMLALYSIKRK